MWLEWYKTYEFDEVPNTWPGDPVERLFGKLYYNWEVVQNDDGTEKTRLSNAIDRSKWIYYQQYQKLSVDKNRADKLFVDQGNMWPLWHVETQRKKLMNTMNLIDKQKKAMDDLGQKWFIKEGFFTDLELTLTSLGVQRQRLYGEFNRSSGVRKFIPEDVAWVKHLYAKEQYYKNMMANAATSAEKQGLEAERDFELDKLQNSAIPLIQQYDLILINQVVAYKESIAMLQSEWRVSQAQVEEIDDLLDAYFPWISTYESVNIESYTTSEKLVEDFLKKNWYQTLQQWKNQQRIELQLLTEVYSKEHLKKFSITELRQFIDALWGNHVEGGIVPDLTAWLPQKLDMKTLEVVAELKEKYNYSSKKTNKRPKIEQELMRIYHNVDIDTRTLNKDTSEWLSQVQNAPMVVDEPQEIIPPGEIDVEQEQLLDDEYLLNEWWLLKDRGDALETAIWVFNEWIRDFQQSGKTPDANYLERLREPVNQAYDAYQKAYTLYRSVYDAYLDRQQTEIDELTMGSSTSGHYNNYLTEYFNMAIQDRPNTPHRMSEAEYAEWTKNQKIYTWDAWSVWRYTKQYKRMWEHHSYSMRRDIDFWRAVFNHLDNEMKAKRDLELYKLFAFTWYTPDGKPTYNKKKDIVIWSRKFGTINRKTLIEDFWMKRSEIEQLMDTWDTDYDPVRTQTRERYERRTLKAQKVLDDFFKIKTEGWWKQSGWWQIVTRWSVRRINSNNDSPCPAFPRDKLNWKDLKKNK